MFDLYIDEDAMRISFVNILRSESSHLFNNLDLFI